MPLGVAGRSRVLKKIVMLGIEQILAAAVTLSAPAPDAAAGPALTWSAPTGCPDQAWVRSRMHRYLAGEDPLALDVAGRIELSETGYRLWLSIDGSPRTLEGHDCARLAEAAALIIAVAADPVAVANTVENVAEGGFAEPSPEPTEVPARSETTGPPPRAAVSTEAPPSTPSSPEPAQPPSSNQTRTSNRRLSGGIRPRLGVGGNALPAAGIGVGAVGLLRGTLPWRIQLGGTFWIPRTVDLGEQADVGARLWLAAGGLDGCWEPRVRTLFGLVCGGLELGALGGSGRGTGIQTRSEAQLWVASTLSGGLGWAIARRLALVLEAQMVVALRRPGFHLDGFGSVHRAGTVAGRGFVGFEVRFP